MKIDFTALDKSTTQAIRTIENKGHARYIRYLLAKRIPPTTIRKELARLALSAPSKEILTIYFVNVLWPLAGHFSLTQFYTEYYDRLLKGTYEKDVTPVLNFDVSFGDDNSARMVFCSFLRELGIEEMWSREVTKYYGGVHNIPQDEEGNRIIKANVTRSVESVLTCPKRYVVDKLLLENVSPSRINKYLWEKYQIKLNDVDIYAYAKYFFNFTRRNVEEIIEQLTSELTSIKNDLEILETSESYSLGDKLAISHQYESKVKFLDESIKELTSRYSDLAYNQGVSEQLEVEDIVKDIVLRGYKRLQFLDRYNDRDVVKPLTDVAKMVFTAVDKMQQIEDGKIKNQGRKNAIDRDKGAHEVLIDLYQEALENHINEAKERLGEPVEDVDMQIEGAEEM